MKTYAITATQDRLIVHEFENEKQALIKMPMISTWERLEWSDQIRYHSKQANRFWKNRKINDKIPSTTMVYKNGIKTYTYND